MTVLPEYLLQVLTSQQYSQIDKRNLLILASLGHCICGKHLT